MNRILLFGLGPLQESIIHRAHGKGVLVVGIDPCPDAPCRSMTDWFETVGGQDYEKTLEVAKKYGISGIITAATDKPLVMMARIAEELKLPFYSVETAKVSTDKYKMKQEFIRNGIPCAEGRTISSADECEGMNYPIIIKPRDNSGSRGVRLCHNFQELSEAVAEAGKFSSLKSVLAEEYIEGQEFSIESLHFNGRHEVIQFTEKKTTEFPYNVELGHIQPADIPEDTRHEIRELIKKIGEGLGFDNCASHTELKINSRGIFIIETSPRLGGDYITSRLVPLSTGINMEDCLIDIALGKEPDIAGGRYEKASGIAFWELPHGRKIEEVRYPMINEENGADEYMFTLKPGDTIPRITNSLNRYGHIITAGETNAEIRERLNTYNRIIQDKIILK